MKAVRAAGLRIPDDVALASFQDPDRVGGILEPPLTTLEAQERELGSHAARLLLHVMDQGSSAISAAEVRLPARLLIRRSCGCDPELAHDP